MDRDSEYYLHRAEAELSLAQAAPHPAAVRAHYHLAGHYLDRAYALGVRKPSARLIRIDDLPTSTENA
ncbi:hypothetical protein ASE00_06550 [Sphingomonas sp. Root710]|uniref:hypothetical protein n=1 Tax=Sphingomonas sp. Root710 TaxID=1736594 RepID=UPI0006F91CB1|nr:hypothetical protein [Sphingomonas sp. Root710]KRB86368.1 hypothetical protein ASE00_06550 [Sphingomonas sp. Root710]